MDARKKMADFQNDAAASARAIAADGATWGNSGNRNIATTRSRAVWRSLDAWQLCVWVYRDQKAHVVNGEALGPSRPRAAAGWAELGTTIDGGGFRRALLHPAAEAVSAFVRTLPQAALLIRYAARGETPDWIPDARNPLWPCWRSGDREGPPPSRNTNRGRRNQAALVILTHPQGGPFCAVEPRYSAAQVGWARQAWRDWHAAVMAIEAEFASRPERLPGIDLRPFHLPAEPWAAPESAAGSAVAMVGASA